MVLGLTMAETLLLLVFCLLMAAASVFSYKLNQLKEAQLEEQALRDSLREAQSKIEVMQTQMPEGVISDNWQHLLRGYPHVETLNKAGVSLKEAADAADVVVVAIKAKENGVTAEDVTKSIALQQIIKKEFSGSPDGVPSNEQIASIIREGRQALTGSNKSGGKGKHDWPPIITLSEADGHYFDTGSAVLSDKFSAALSGPVVDQLLRIIANYPDVNVIEVIGHTDEQPLVQRPSNLDELLMPVLQRKSSVVRLTPADNAGLGLARAVSVAQVLLNDKRLSRFAILPYSGAQLVNVNDSLVLTSTGASVKERRRIEIRVRKSDRVELPTAAPRTTTIKKRALSPSSTTAEINTAGTQSQPTLPDPQPPKPAAEVQPESKGVKKPFRWLFRN